MEYVLISIFEVTKEIHFKKFLEEILKNHEN